MPMLQTQDDAISPLAPTYNWIDLDDLHSEPLKAGAEWWRAARGSRPFPAREDLKPRQIRGLLPHMSLLKVIDGGADFEHRIVGDVMVQAFNVRLQHRRFSELAHDSPEFIERCFTIFRMVVTSGEPLAWRAVEDGATAPLVFEQAEVVLLPLGHEKVDHLLGFYCHALSAG
jgi:hypothetical protein